MHKKKAGKLQTGIIFPKQYWLAVNGKPIMNTCRRVLQARLDMLRSQGTMSRSHLLVRRQLCVGSKGVGHMCHTDKFYIYFHNENYKKNTFCNIKIQPRLKATKVLRGVACYYEMLPSTTFEKNQFLLTTKWSRPMKG